jgi:pimeloyl-ACP methyl ester carboxylesterase
VHYDPKIVMQLTYHKADLDVWDAYDAIEAKTLITRGENSDVLAASVAEAMKGRGPKPDLHVVPGCGHAPTLANGREIGLLRSFLAD